MKSATKSLAAAGKARPLAKASGPRNPLPPSHPGTVFNVLFTMCPVDRYDGTMFMLALAAVAAQPAAPVAVTRHVRAMVKIVSAPPIRFKELEQQSPQLLRDAQVRAVDGSLERVRLVEFQ